MPVPAWVAGLVKPIAGIIDDLTLSKEEKLAAHSALLSIQTELTTKVLEYEAEVVNAQASIIKAEAQGDSWIQKSWRPILMLTAVVIIANNYVLAPYIQAIFNTSIMLDLPSELWNLLTIGVGGYVVARSGEKIVWTLKNGKSESDQTG